MKRTRAVRAQVRTEHNVHFGSRYGGRYAGLSGGAGLVALPEGFHFRKSERPVQPASRTMHPLDADVDRPPLGFDPFGLEVLDGFEVERTTIAEVQTRPQAHPDSIGEWAS